jgi:simple sugar transport system substrate-binding protein
VAKKFPDVKFEHATGFKTRAERHAPTMRASMKAATSRPDRRQACPSRNVAGYIASFPIPEVVMGINAFMLGAQSVNPDFKVKVVWVNTWFDPARKPTPPRR